MGNLIEACTNIKVFGLILSYTTTGISGVILGLIANYMSPRFNNWVNGKISAFSFWLNPERFDLTGNWEQTFEEPTPESTSPKRTVTEKIYLNHAGFSITGDGTTNIDPRHFTYKCTIKHSMLFGEYVKKAEQGNISGNGLIQLIVSPDRLSMEGQTTWYDNDTKKIESSHARWVKTR